jgi:hypothetical protein
MIPDGIKEIKCFLQCGLRKLQVCQGRRIFDELSVYPRGMASSQIKVIEAGEMGQAECSLRVNGMEQRGHSRLHTRDFVKWRGDFDEAESGEPRHVLHTHCQQIQDVSQKLWLQSIDFERDNLPLIWDHEFDATND